MPFQKKNVILSDKPPIAVDAVDLESQLFTPTTCNTRPSPLDGTPTISTGTASLDPIIAGAHHGLPLGTSLLIQESGTADYGGLLSRYYAAQGLVDGHRVHALGLSDSWKADLPGLSIAKNRQSVDEAPAAEMRIAWRYGTSYKGLPIMSTGAIYHTSATYIALTWSCFDFQSGSSNETRGGHPFCHTFDLSSRLKNSDIKGRFHGIPLRPDASCLTDFMQHLAHELEATSLRTIHRVLIPNLITPGLYSAIHCDPMVLLGFLSQLRALLRQFPERLVAICTSSTALHSRQAGLTRWMEMLADGVLELMPSTASSLSSIAEGSGVGTQRYPQGFLAIHKLALYQEQALASRATTAAMDSYSYRISNQSGMAIYPYSLPPAEDGAVVTSDKDGGASILSF